MVQSLNLMGRGALHNYLVTKMAKDSDLYLSIYEIFDSGERHKRNNNSDCNDLEKEISNVLTEEFSFFRDGECIAQKGEYHY